MIVCKIISIDQIEFWDDKERLLCTASVVGIRDALKMVQHLVAAFMHAQTEQMRLNLLEQAEACKPVQNKLVGM